MPIDRRQFVASAAAAAATCAAPAVHGAKKVQTYRTALIGSGWWGMNILREAVASERVKVVALCDVDQDKLELAAEEIEDLCGDQAKSYGDYREMLDKEQIDIVIIATPDHWHALNAIAALEKGCHVFVEKPTGHTVGESRAMVDVARATDRTVQVGLHRRVGPHHVSANQFLKAGNAGTIGAVKMFVNSQGGVEQPTRNSEAPDTLDWEMYCGPAPLRPFNRKIHPGGFRHFLDFANGTLGDWGVHWLDQMLWWSEERYPKSVYSTGGRPVKGPAVLTDALQTTDAPDHQTAVYQFESFTATWEHRKFAGKGPERHSVGCYFYGDRGTLHVGWRDGWTFYPTDAKKPIQHEDSQLQEPDGHNMQLLWADFLQAIESGKRPACDVLIGHEATNLSLLGMLSFKLGRSIAWDGATETIPGDDEANRLLRREYRGPWQYPS